MLLEPDVVEHITEEQIDACFQAENRIMLLRALRDQPLLTKLWILQRLGDWLKIAQEVLGKSIKYEFFPSIDYEMGDQLVNHFRNYFKQEIEALP